MNRENGPEGSEYKNWNEKADELQRRIGYTFRDGALLRQCCTLSSHSKQNNERLEFLGDAIIEMFVSEALYRFSDAKEGDMTKIRQMFVSNKSLKEVVEHKGLQEFLIYQGSDDNIGTKPVASLFEALVAGIYLDGGLEAARTFVSKSLLIDENNILAREENIQGGNYKGALQELMQSKGANFTAEYLLSGREGPDHCPTFLVEVRAAGLSATGQGKSKAEAQQAAAKNLLEKLKQV